MKFASSCSGSISAINGRGIIVVKQDKVSEPFDKISPELWLMLACAGGDNLKVQNLMQQPVNWGLFLQLAVHHRVYPLAYKTLSQLSNSVVPEHVLSFLRKKYQENTIYSLSLTGETVRMVRALEGHGIRCIVLKGAPLAWRLYGDIAIRPSRDIDILVPFEQLEKAMDILESEGYHEINVLTTRQFEIYFKNIKKNHHHLDYQHSKKNIFLELHWKPSRGFHLFPEPTDNILKRTMVMGNSLPVLSDEEWLLYLMVHGARHGWFRLRWLADIAKFTQIEGIDWKKISLLAQEFGVVSILQQSLILANRLFSVPIPLGLVFSVSNDRSAWRLACVGMNLCLTTADCEIMGNSEQSNYFRKIYNAQLWPGWKNRLNTVLKPFKPTISDIKLISLPDRLYAAYYFIRPIYWLWRRLRRLNLIRPHN